jgi:hypothetical protein
MRNDSLGIKEPHPSEITSKHQVFMFTNAIFYFSNAMTSFFDYGLMGSK